MNYLSQTMSVEPFGIWSKSANSVLEKYRSHDRNPSDPLVTVLLYRTVARDALSSIGFQRNLGDCRLLRLSPSSHCGIASDLLLFSSFFSLLKKNKKYALYFSSKNHV